MNLILCAKDYWWLKDTKDTSDATLKTSQIKDVKLRLPSKDLQIETSVDVHPSDWEAPTAFYGHWLVIRSTD